MAHVFVRTSSLEVPNAYGVKDLADKYNEAASEMLNLIHRVCQFIDRKIHPNLKLNSGPDDPYDLLSISGHYKTLFEFLFPTKKASTTELEKLLCASMQTVFREDLGLADQCFPLVVGKAFVTADDALYAAWKIERDMVGREVHVVVARTARYDNFNMWLLEGDPRRFLSPTNIGWLKDVDETLFSSDKFSLDKMQTDDGKTTLRIRTALPLEGYMKYFEMALREGLISAQS